nr:hypothetical protein KPHV_87490 [Kitasatospora purpeofusca]
MAASSRTETRIRGSHGALHDNREVRDYGRVLRRAAMQPPAHHPVREALVIAGGLTAA